MSIKSVEEMGMEKLAFEIVKYENLIRSCVISMHSVSNFTIQNHWVDLGVGADIIMFLRDLKKSYCERMTELELAIAEREQHFVS